MKDDDWRILIKAIQAENCILMLGPETASVELEGQDRPLMEMLAYDLANEIQIKDIDSFNLPLVAQQYEMEEGRNGLEYKAALFYEKRWNQGSEFHQHMAALPFYLIVSSSHDGLLYEAFKNNQEKKLPIIEWYNFRGDKKDMVKMGTVKAPLIYHLYGSIQEPESLVITENDMLDFLVAIIKKKPALPYNIVSELQNDKRCFLFLRFGFRHWYLRILLHILQGSRKVNRSFALEQFSKANVNELKNINFFYKKGYKIDIFDMELGSFVKELRQRYDEFSKSSAMKIQTKEEETHICPEAPNLFICYASEDAARAVAIYKQLYKAGFNPWLDGENIRGGDLWDGLIEKTVKEVDYFIVLLSKSLEKKTIGYVNKEIHIALQHQLYYREGTRFIIPVKIEECSLLDELKDIQVIDLYRKNNIDELVSTVKRDQQRRMR